jgi:hypothetical protein
MIASYLMATTKPWNITQYDKELRPFPHPRSQEPLEALARWRGAESGLKSAEAFVTIRERHP